MPTALSGHGGRSHAGYGGSRVEVSMPTQSSGHGTQTKSTRKEYLIADLERTDIRPTAFVVAPSFIQAAAAEDVFDDGSRLRLHAADERRTEGGFVAAGLVMILVKATR